MEVVGGGWAAGPGSRLLPQRLPPPAAALLPHRGTSLPGTPSAAGMFHSSLWTFNMTILSSLQTYNFILMLTPFASRF